MGRGSSSTDVLRQTMTSFVSSGNTYSLASLPSLESCGFGNISRLPYSLRVLVECVLRKLDGQAFFPEHLQKLTSWKPQGEREEIPFMPARVVLQDFTGVPAVVDLAAMRDAMHRLGKNPERINPLVPCDLVIDHSVQVDVHGLSTALGENERIEFIRNTERYRLLKWAQKAFKNFRVVPPSMGIVHQVNLEYLSLGVMTQNIASGDILAFPDSCVGTDSHTTMTNGLGVLSWGVGGIEAEAVMLGQPIYMLIPDVVGIRLTGELPESATATDLVLRVTELCRKVGVVGKFVEFFGPGVSKLSLADRATVSNMAPEQGSTVTYFPVDEETLKYLRNTGRKPEQVALVESYFKEQQLFFSPGNPEPEFSQVMELDLGTIEGSIAGPKRPHDRLPLTQVSKSFAEMLVDPVGPKGFGLDQSKVDVRAAIKSGSSSENKGESEITHGAVVLAAITSCTNTSNPRVMLGAGLLAKKAVERGLKVPAYVKASLAPGSRVVTEYLKEAGLLSYLEQLGFYVVGYGCTSCIGNSGPLDEDLVKAITENDLVVSAVLSGNRNFEGRVNPHTRANFLASPPLVVAYALLGSTAKDICAEPIGTDQNGSAVYLRDIWPTKRELDQAEESANSSAMYIEQYAKVGQGSSAWAAIAAGVDMLYPWDDDSTYIQNPPFFSSLTSPDSSKSDGCQSEECQSTKGSLTGRAVNDVRGARVLALFADSVTTDHISPAGSIAKGSPAGVYLESLGVGRVDWNSYGARRGNHQVMMRGTFANTRLRNHLVPGSEGNVTIHYPSGQKMSIYEAAMLYQSEHTPLVILAGKEYGSGSSRDWAAKGPQLLGVKVVIAQSFERIHRSNLIGMGVLPLEFVDNESAATLGLTGEETIDVYLPEQLLPLCEIKVTASSGAEKKEFLTRCRIDTPIEVEYYRAGGILTYVLGQLS